MSSSQQKKNATIVQMALAEFDIETQVKKITLETMDAFMKGNQQAFQYIKEWESKFIEFQTRLVLTENYHKNIELKINSKMEAMNNVSGKLEKFSQQFWEAMKETAASVEQMRKNYLNLVRESGTQAASQRAFQRQLKESSLKSQKLEQKLNEESSKIYQKITETDENLTSKNTERKKQGEKILLTLSQSRAVLESKIELLSELVNDMAMYKDEKNSINSRIEKLYESVSERVLKSEFYQIRRYIDNNSSKQKKEFSEKFQTILSTINQQGRQRSAEVQRIEENILALASESKAKYEQIQSSIQQESEKIWSDFQDFKLKTGQELSSVQNKVLQNDKSIEKCADDAAAAQKKLAENIETILDDLTLKQNRLAQVESNILSINDLIGKIQGQNLRRNQELAEMRVDAKDQGDLGDQLKQLAIKIISHDQFLRCNQEQTGKNAQSIQNVSALLSSKFEQFQQNLKSTSEKLEQKQKQSDKRMDSMNLGLTEDIVRTKKECFQYCDSEILQKILAIKDKFDFLNKISGELGQFRQTFDQQLKVNEQINVEVKQKMERIFSVFTKLKSDIFIKMETITQEQAKGAAKLKDNCQKIGDICGYLSLESELITALLSVEVWREHSQDNSEMFRVASILEGWVLEIEDRDRVKYRGESITKRALMQSYLQYHIRVGDKIKGGIIENSKNIFERICGESDEGAKMKRRSISRKKNRQSELPKVYR